MDFLLDRPFLYRLIQVDLLHHAVHSAAPLGGGHAPLRLFEPRTGEFPLPGGAGARLLRRFGVQQAAFHLGGRDLGGQLGQDGVGVVPGQPGQVGFRRFLCGFCVMLPSQAFRLAGAMTENVPVVGRLEDVLRCLDAPQLLRIRPCQDGQQHPFAHRVPLEQGAWVGMSTSVGQEACDGLGGVGQGHDQNQLVLCPGHGHIEQAQFLRLHLLVQL